MPEERSDSEALDEACKFVALIVVCPWLWVQKVDLWSECQRCSAVKKPRIEREKCFKRWFKEADKP